MLPIINELKPNIADNTGGNIINHFLINPATKK